jgi:large subunit ribosomal protein L22e
MTTKEATTKSVPKVKTEEKKAEQKISHAFTIDCSKPVEDKVFNTSNFAEFLRARIKIGGRVGHLGESIKVTSDDKKITVKADVSFSKRYLKYLTKKYLKKHSLREFLYVVAASKSSYQIKYFNIQQEGAEQE